MLLLVSQFSTLVFEIARYTTSQDILQAFSDDGAAAIEVASKTRWYSDNRWSAYGPLYYRLTHTLAILAPLPNESENYHFHLLLTSLLAAYSLCALVAWTLGIRGPELVVSTCFLVCCFLSQSEWMKMLIQAHPDWLLSFTAGLSAFAAVHVSGVSWHLDKSLRLLALSLALGMLTKASFVFFLPATILLVMRRVDVRLHFKKIILTALGFYFLLGFPQAFRVDRDLRFLSRQSQFSQSPDWGSTVEWLELFGSQLSWPLLGAVAVFLLFATPRMKPLNAPKVRWRSIDILWLLLPLVLLMSRKIISENSYYTLPFVAFFLVGLSHLAADRLSLPWQSERVRAWSFIGVILVSVMFGLMTPKGMGDRLALESECREQAHDVRAAVEEHLKKKTLVYVDPYVPFPRSPEFKPLIKGNWRSSWEQVHASGAQVMVLSRKFYGRYLEPMSEYVLKQNPKAATTADFYRAIDSASMNVTAPTGEVWQLEKSFTCGWRIWKQSP